MFEEEEETVNFPEEEEETVNFVRYGGHRTTLRAHGVKCSCNPPCKLHFVNIEKLTFWIFGIKGLGKRGIM